MSFPCCGYCCSHSSLVRCFSQHFSVPYSLSFSLPHLINLCSSCCSSVSNFAHYLSSLLCSVCFLFVSSLSPIGQVFVFGRWLLSTTHPIYSSTFPLTAPNPSSSTQAHLGSPWSLLWSTPKSWSPAPGQCYVSKVSLILPWVSSSFLSLPLLLCLS